MPGISVTDQIDSLLTTTLRNYRKKMVNNIFEPMRTLKWLQRARGAGKEYGSFDLRGGGHQIAEHLLYGKNTTIAARSQYEQIDTTPQEGHTMAFYEWREYNGTISISRKEQRMNSGEAQLINLLQAKVEQAEMSLKDSISTDLFADISASPAKKLDSLLLHANDSPSTTTVGSISGATYSWWRNYQADVGSYGGNLEAKMRTAFNTVAKWGEPDAIVCTQQAFEYYESLAVNLKRFPAVQNDKATADLGFQVLKYKGTDLFFDYDFAQGTPLTGDSMLFLNSKYLKLVMDRESNFVTTDFIEPENQTAKVAKVLAMFNVTCCNRASLGLLHGIDA